MNEYRKTGTRIVCNICDMKLQRTNILFLLFLLLFPVFLLKTVPACADLSPYEMPAMEASLLTRINQARQNPLETAVALGESADQILAAQPDRTDILVGGLDPLTLDSRLHDSAIAHTLDMLEKNYYSQTGASGSSPQDRISAAGLSFTHAAEVLGVVAFRNFMDPESAVDILFKNAFLREVKGETTSPVLLDKTLTDIGIGVASGTLTIAGASYNVYLMTCDAASMTAQIDGYDTTRMAAQLTQLINQARAFPLDVAEKLGFARADVLNTQTSASAYLHAGMPPLAVDGQLSASASAHTDEMMRLGYFSETSPDGKTAEDRIRESGYDILYAGELIFQYSGGMDTSADEMVAAIFNMIFSAELATDEAQSDSFRLMLERDLEDIGVSLGCIQETVDGVEQIRCIGTVVAGLKLTWENPKIAGVVYSDTNRDGLYTPGEELPGQEILVFGDGILKTDAAGRFQLPSEPGIYHISMIQAESAMHKEVDLDYDNKGIYFQLDEETGGEQ